MNFSLTMHRYIILKKKQAHNFSDSLLNPNLHGEPILSLNIKKRKQLDFLVYVPDAFGFLTKIT